MNLFDMLRREDRSLVIDGDVTMAKNSIDGEIWRGLQLMPGSSFRIVDARRFITFRSFAQTCGWTVFGSDGCSLRLSVIRHGGSEVLSSRTFDGASQQVSIPWPKSIPGLVDLLAECEGDSPQGLFVAGHRALSRQWLYDAAVGAGIEIGPGPQPQILPQDDRQVCYVEQMPPDEWNRLYNRGGKYPVRPELWGDYIVGDASNLSLADASLDFIFASHVFEHLVNPIGHLIRWNEKLAPGGKVICVVPDLGATKDAVQERSTLSEWIEELEEGIWEPAERHYCRHLGCAPGDKRVRAAMERRESIHAHYYDNINCRDLLDYAVNELGYSDFVIEHTPNHKDFHFLLQKP